MPEPLQDLLQKYITEIGNSFLAKSHPVISRFVVCLGALITDLYNQNRRLSQELADLKVLYGGQIQELQSRLDVQGRAAE